MLIFPYDVISWNISVTPSTLKAVMKFWGTCLKLWKLEDWRKNQNLVFDSAKTKHKTE